jgi:hypothetical protein
MAQARAFFVEVLPPGVLPPVMLFVEVLPVEVSFAGPRR